jgi:predicted alpha/beta-fold hydrolase
MNQPLFAIESFRPSPLWHNAHAQTVLANSLRSANGVRFHRLRLDTPDGDFLDLDFPTVPGLQLAQDAPVVLLLHGLEGSARRSYACETYKQLARRGVRAVGLNFRSCSGEMNRTQHLYHAGATDDVALVMAWLEQRLPGIPKGLIGFSLGGNTLLKYLGEQGTAVPACAAAVVSPPFDLARVADNFAQGEGRRYAERFVKSLQQKALQHARQHGHAFDLHRVYRATTMREFDEAFTAPLHGYRDADEYYAANSCAPYLDGIHIPTLVIRALDDPFFASDIPHARLAANPALLPVLTSHGGHVAFAEGVQPYKFEYWAERQAARFLSAFLCKKDSSQVS